MPRWEGGTYIPYDDTYLNGLRMAARCAHILGGGATEANSSRWMDRRGGAERRSVEFGIQRVPWPNRRGINSYAVGGTLGLVIWKRCMKWLRGRPLIDPDLYRGPEGRLAMTNCRK